MCKRYRYLFICLFLMFFSVSSVRAVTYSSDERYYFNATTGAYSTTNTGHIDSVKKLDGEYAYCVQWKKKITNTNYAKDTTWKTTSKSAILAGIMMDIVDSKYEGTQRYGMTAATLNTFYARYLKNAYSYNFYSANSTIKSIYDQAVKEYANYKVTKYLPKLTMTVGNSTFNYSNNIYISDKITLTGMVDTYGGSNDKTTYVISAGDNGKICSKASGAESSCKTSVTVPAGKTSYSFYVKATGVTSDDEVKVKVSGTNSSTYPSSIRYTSDSYSQVLLAKTKFTLNRTRSMSLILTVPDLTNHRIVAYKLDENGDLLTGATLEIYKDDYAVASNLLVKNDGNVSKITYTTPKVSEVTDDFFLHDYYLVEKSAPDGYVLNSTVNQFHMKNAGSAASSSCYYNGGSDSDESEKVDSERCNFENYVYKCKSSADNSIIDLSEAGNCEFTTPDDSGTSEGTTSGGETTSGDTTGDGATAEGSTGDGTSEGETTPTVQYTQICYNVSKAKEETDMTFCSDKDNYIKVVKSGGNITVQQVNKKNNVKISKRATTGDDEVAGASLKICTSDSYKSKANDCEVAKTIDDVEMSWISGTQPYEFSGLKVGDYYIVETIAPVGYIKASTATSFTITVAGEVKTGNKVADDNTVVIKNSVSKFSVSKQDAATSKELPGATISICTTYVDESNNIQMDKNQYTGECVPAILADGSVATWVSTSEPKMITGLSAGTYYLVERIAPTNYSTAESILFKITDKGELVDKDGKSLADNKLVMKDTAIVDPKTGEFPIYVAIALVVVALGLGIGSYYFINKKGSMAVLKKPKIRKRKLHK